MGISYLMQFQNSYDITNQSGTASVTIDRTQQTFITGYVIIPVDTTEFLLSYRSASVQQPDHDSGNASTLTGGVRFVF